MSSPYPTNATQPAATPASGGPFRVSPSPLSTNSPIAFGQSLNRQQIAGSGLVAGPIPPQVQPEGDSPMIQVASMLQSLSLERYIGAFRAQEYDNLDVVMKLSPQDFDILVQAVGLEPGSASKLGRHIFGASEPQPHASSSGFAWNEMDHGRKWHISYSREDSELLSSTQSKVHEAGDKIKGIMTNQGGALFAAWEQELMQADAPGGHAASSGHAAPFLPTAPSHLRVAPSGHAVPIVPPAACLPIELANKFQGGDMINLRYPGLRLAYQSSRRHCPIFEVEDFLSPLEVEQLRAKMRFAFDGDSVRESATFLHDDKLGERKSRDFRVPYQQTPSIHAKLASLTGRKQVSMESLKLIRYDEGGLFEPHYDFQELTDDTKDHITSKGYPGYTNPELTVFVYLNTPTDGGETAFFDCLGTDALTAMRKGDKSKITYQAKPKAGMAVLFWATTQTWEQPTQLPGESMTKDGILLHELGAHAGLPPSGVKEIAACWIWPFGIDVMQDVMYAQPYHFCLPDTDRVVI